MMIIALESIRNDGCTDSNNGGKNGKRIIYKIL